MIPNKILEKLSWLWGVRQFFYDFPNDIPITELEMPSFDRRQSASHLLWRFSMAIFETADWSQRHSYFQQKMGSQGATNSWFFPCFRPFSSFSWTFLWIWNFTHNFPHDFPWFYHNVFHGFPHFTMDFATFFSSPDFWQKALVQRALRPGRFAEPAAAHLQLAPWVQMEGQRL